VDSLDHTEQTIKAVDVFVEKCGVEWVVAIDQSSTAKRLLHPKLKVADECYFVLKLIAQHLSFKEFVVLGD